MYAAAPMPEPGTSALPVIAGSKVNWPLRGVSLAMRRFWPRRTSAPHLKVWLPEILDQLFTNWSTYSRSSSGQLHWLLPRLKPVRQPPLPLIRKYDNPVVSIRLERLIPGTPASCTGVVPKSSPRTWTRYLENPNRTSVKSDGLTMRLKPAT